MLLTVYSNQFTSICEELSAEMNYLVTCFALMFSVCELRSLLFFQDKVQSRKRKEGQSPSAKARKKHQMQRHQTVHTSSGKSQSRRRVLVLVWTLDCPLLKGNQAPHLKFEIPN